MLANKFDDENEFEEQVEYGLLFFVKKQMTKGQKNEKK